MLTRIASFSFVVAATVSLTACIDADVKTTLKADGSGTMKLKMALTEGMVGVVSKMKAIDPDDDSLDELQMIDVSEPTEEERAAMEAAGVVLVSAKSVADEKTISSELEVGFRTLAGLESLGAIVEEEDRDMVSGMRLTRETDGTYVLAMSGGDDDDDDEEEDEDPFGLEDEDEDEDEDEGETGDSELDAKKAELALEMMGAMFSEMSKFKMAIALEVPGEIVSFAPKALGKQDGQTVTWTIDFAAISAAAGAGEEPSMEEGFSVRFRMPEGKEIPESALWSGPAKAEAPAAGEDGEDEM